MWTQLNHKRLRKIQTLHNNKIQKPQHLNKHQETHTGIQDLNYIKIQSLRISALTHYTFKSDGFISTTYYNFNKHVESTEFR